MCSLKLLIKINYAAYYNEQQSGFWVFAWFIKRSNLNWSSDKLSKNGSNFGSGIIAPTFQGIAQNLTTIKGNIPNNNDFNNLLKKFDAITGNQNNDVSKLYGFTKDDYAELDNFYEQVRTIKDKSLDNQASLGDIRALTTLGNTTLNKLVAKYKLDTGTSSGSSGSGNNDGTTNR
jgi:hypothetical protein